MHIATDIAIMATSPLPQLPKQAEMVMTTCWKKPVTTGPDLAEVDVPSSTDELPVQQNIFGWRVGHWTSDPSLQDVN